MWATRIDIEGETFHTLEMVVQLAPDQEAFILQRIRSGRFATVDEAVREAVGLLKDQEAGKTARRAAGRKSLAQLFAESPFKGTGMDFVRDTSPLRPVDF